MEKNDSKAQILISFRNFINVKSNYKKIKYGELRNIINPNLKILTE